MAGRPLKFKSVEDLQMRIDLYFNNTPKEEITITGLALALDTSRETLCNYEEREEFFDTIKKAKDRAENAFELRALKVGNAFDIFRLKNMGWRDKQDIEHSGAVDTSGLNADQKSQLDNLIKPDGNTSSITGGDGRNPGGTAIPL